MNRKRLLLAALLGLLGLSLAYAYWAMPRQEQAPPRAAAPRPAAKAASPGKVVSQPAANRLHLGLLDQTEQPFPGSGRDIFRFQGRWSPVPTVAEVPPEKVVPPPPPPPPPTPQELLRQALASYKVLGFLEKGGVRSLFLTDGKDVLVIKPGERFGSRGNFIASEITAKELVVAQKSDPSVTVRLPLGDVRNQEPAVMSPVSVPRPEAEAEPPPSPPAGQPGRRSRVRPGAAAEELQQGEVAPVPGATEQVLPSGEEE